MKKLRYCSLVIILIILAYCFSGCVAVQPTPAEGLESASPEQSVQLITENPTKRPIDELIKPGYDVKTSILWDLNGDIAKETISVGLGDAREIGNDILLAVSDNGKFNTVAMGSGYFEIADYLVTAGGAPCVIVSISCEDDSSSTFAVSFDGLNPVIQGSVDGIAEEVSGSGWIAVSTKVDALGTWPCTRVYAVTDEFSFEPSGDFFIKTGSDPLIIKGPVAVEIWKDGDYTTVTLEAGTSIVPYMTDGKTYVSFRVKDPEPESYTEGRIDFTRSGNECFIGGKSEYDCFENVPYAG